MTSMIDVVFLLLTFFVMTFKIIIPEGDINVTMSPQGQQQVADVPNDPLKIRLFADAEGDLSAIQLNEEDIDSTAVLQQRVSAFSLQKPDLEIVIYSDEHLHYKHLIAAFTAVNAEIREGEIRTICDHIQFARQQ